MPGRLVRRFATGLMRLAKLNYLKILRIKTSAHSIALGMAFGVFIGFMPVIPFQTVTVLALAFLFRANKITAVLATWISNPINMVPFYYVLYRVGDFVLPFQVVDYDPGNMDIRIMLDLGWRFLAVMFVGGAVMGTPSSVVTYLVTRKLVLSYRKRRALRLLRKRTEL